ncbi:hypothetical protein [Pantoea sp. SM3]|uniref:hypothetical protein n=1 Tax=Pantoea sp. SM3 TaxID=1628192 RepID=UPI000697F442|nr:hypothetical protein [Pantoea sp. SM3]
MLVENIRSHLNACHAQSVQCRKIKQPRLGEIFMESRIRKLEETVAIIATDVAVIKSNYATKQDMAEVRTEIVEVKLEIGEVRSEVREVKGDVASVKENYATKADVLAIRGDLYQALNKQTKWMVSMQFVTLGLALTIAKAIF